MIMIKKYASIFAMLATATLFNTSFAQASSTQTSLAPMLKNVMPSVVQITVEEKSDDSTPEYSPFNQSNNDATTDDSSTAPTSMGMGTGVIINAKNGIIVTNAHVVKDASQIVVTLNTGDRYYGDLIAKDTDLDIAVLHINAKHLHEMPLASMKDVHVGDFVTAIGTPFGLNQTVTTGTISALNRADPHIGDLDSLIQTDAAINPGNSGGPLINRQGEMVGMNSALLGPSMNIGLGFAIPIDVVAPTAKQLVEYGNVKQGLLGVVTQPLTAILAHTLHAPVIKGALITTIMPGSAAAKGGLKSGDIITAIDDIPAQSGDEVKTLVSLSRPGQSISVNYYHNGKQQVKSFTLLSPEQTQSNTPAMPFMAGLQLQNLNALSNSGTSLAGLLVTDVMDHSQALLSGISPGDIIVAINGKPCASINTMKSILATIPSTQNTVLVKVYSNNEYAYTTIRRQ